jgi:hypothetical protein
MHKFLCSPNFRLVLFERHLYQAMNVPSPSDSELEIKSILVKVPKSNLAKLKKEEIFSVYGSRTKVCL